MCVCVCVCVLKAASGKLNLLNGVHTQLAQVTSLHAVGKQMSIMNVATQPCGDDVASSLVQDQESPSNMSTSSTFPRPPMQQLG